MSSVVEFPIRMIPKGNDLSQYSDRAIIQHIMLQKAHLLNEVRTGKLTMTEDLRNSLNEADRILTKHGYMT